MMPVDGSRPASWWQPSWKIRDVYHLNIDPNASLGPASLDLVLYDSFAQERILFDGNDWAVRLLEVNIFKKSQRK